MAFFDYSISMHALLFMQGYNLRLIALSENIPVV
jgi:hypothetical protein